MKREKHWRWKKINPNTKSILYSLTHTADVIVLPSECVYISIHSFIAFAFPFFFVFSYVAVFLSAYFLARSFFPGVRFSVLILSSQCICVCYLLENRLPFFNSHQHLKTTNLTNRKWHNNGTTYALRHANCKQYDNNKMSVIA